MDNYAVDLKLYRIINGYFYIDIKNQKYKIIYPDMHKKYEAEQLYVSILQDSRFDTEYLKPAELDRILRSNDIWSDEEQEKLDKIDTEIDKYKIKLYEHYSNEDLRERIKKELETLKKYRSELFMTKHSLDYLTLNFFAQNIKNQFLISQCVLNQDDKPVFGKDYYSMDLDLLKNIITETQKDQISAEDLRQICRSDTWKRYLCSDNIFGPTIHLNDDQVNLLSLQKMYDNVAQHPECPDEKIIEDPDALDGWFLYQKDKNKKNKKKNQALNKVRGKVKGHDFVYIMSQDAEESAAIEDMNDHRGKQLIAGFRKTAQTAEKDIKWKDIPFIKQDLQNQAFEKFKNRK